MLFPTAGQGDTVQTGRPGAERDQERLRSPDLGQISPISSTPGLTKHVVLWFGKLSISLPHLHGSPVKRRVKVAVPGGGDVP